MSPPAMEPPDDPSPDETRIMEPGRAADPTAVQPTPYRDVSAPSPPIRPASDERVAGWMVVLSVVAVLLVLGAIVALNVQNFDLDLPDFGVGGDDTIDAEDDLDDGTPSTASTTPPTTPTTSGSTSTSTDTATVAESTSTTADEVSSSTEDVTTSTSATTTSTVAETTEAGG